MVGGRAAGEALVERLERTGQLSLVGDLEGHRPDATGGRRACRPQAALEQPALERGGVRIVAHGGFQKVALDADADGVGGRVTLTAPAPPLGRDERGEYLLAELRGPELAGPAPASPPPPEQAGPAAFGLSTIRTPSGKPSPCGLA
jgi:hypothetical protein